MSYSKFNIINQETRLREEVLLYSSPEHEKAYDEAFEPFHRAQPENEKELYIYRDIVEEFSLQQLRSVPPDLVIDYAKYQALREAYIDRSHEKVCPHCEEPLKLTDMHKKSYDEIATALMRLINLYSGGLEVGVDAI